MKQIEIPYHLFHRLFYFHGADNLLDRKFICNIFFRIDAVIFFHIASPAVNPADASHCAADRKHRSSRHRKFLVMRRIFQFFGRIRNTGKSKPFFTGCKRKTGLFHIVRTVIQCFTPIYRHPFRLHVHSAFLRDKIRRDRKTIHFIDTRDTARHPIRISLP